MVLRLKGFGIKAGVLLLITALLAGLALAVASSINQVAFWALAAASAVFAFKVLPKIKQ